MNYYSFIIQTLGSTVLDYAKELLYSCYYDGLKSVFNDINVIYSDTGKWSFI
jgi:hypothetical protein